MQKQFQLSRGGGGSQKTEVRRQNYETRVDDKKNSV